MRWHLRHPRMVERKCLQCGEAWTLRARRAKVRHPGGSGRGSSAPVIMAGMGNPNLMANPGMESIIIGEELLAENRRRDAEADSDAEVVRQVRQTGVCPKCGSIDRYTQRRLS